MGFVSICALGAGIGYVWTEMQKLSDTVSLNAGEVDDHVLAQERRNDALGAGLSDLKTSVIASEEANRTVADTVTDLSGRIGDLNRALDERIAQISEDQQMLTQEMNTWAKTTSQQGEAIEVIENQVTLAKQEMEKIAQKAQSRFDTLATDLRDQIGRIDSVDTSMGNTDEAIQAMNQFINQLETNYADVESELVAVRSGFTEQQTQISDLASALAIVQIELAQVRSATSDDLVAAVETSVIDETVDVPEDGSGDDVPGEEVTGDPFAAAFLGSGPEPTIDDAPQEAVVSEEVTDDGVAAAAATTDSEEDFADEAGVETTLAVDAGVDPTTVRQGSVEPFSPFENGSN